MVAAQSKPSTALFQRSLDFSITGENYVDIFRTSIGFTGRKVIDKPLTPSKIVMVALPSVRAEPSESSAVKVINLSEPTGMLLSDMVSVVPGSKSATVERAWGMSAALQTMRMRTVPGAIALLPAFLACASAAAMSPLVAQLAVPGLLTVTRMLPVSIDSMGERQLVNSKAVINNAGKAGNTYAAILRMTFFACGNVGAGFSVIVYSDFLEDSS
jgi:hypothetical protein